MREELGKAVVVTGASAGIGRATAARLADLGFEVFAGVRRPEDAAELAALGQGRIVPLPLDVTDADAVARAARSVAQHLGSRGLHGLVNNAGIALASPLEFLPLDDLRRLLEVNVVGVAAVTQAFLPRLRQSTGRIVNVGSMAGRLAMPFLGAYAASKGGLRSLTDALRLELRPWDIRVCLVEPGVISTRIYERVTSEADALLARLPEGVSDRYRPQIAALRSTSEAWIRRASPPETVARVIGQALLARHPRARYLVGAGAHVQALLAATLPPVARDAIIAAALGLPRRVEGRDAGHVGGPAPHRRGTDHA